MRKNPIRKITLQMAGEIMAMRVLFEYVGEGSANTACTSLSHWGAITNEVSGARDMNITTRRVIG